MSLSQPLKIGFDMDGVLLYNPVRTLRPVAELLKKIIPGHIENKKNLYIPKTGIEIFLWRLLHMTSLFPAAGVDHLQNLIKENNIEAHIITARYRCLKQDFEHWIKVLQTDQYFKKSWYNANNEQPHLFKERMIKELELKYFFEDNWFIVEHLHKTVGRQTKIFWISNLLDYHINYPYKFLSFRDAISEFEQQINA